MVEGKVFIVHMRIEQPEASGRIQSSEKRHRLDMVSRLNMAVRGGGARGREGEKREERGPREGTKSQEGRTKKVHGQNGRFFQALGAGGKEAKLLGWRGLRWDMGQEELREGSGTEYPEANISFGIGTTSSCFPVSLRDLAELSDSVESWRR